MANGNGDEFDWFLLSRTPGVGVKTFHSLIEAFSSPEGVFMASQQDFVSAGCNVFTAQAICDMYKKRETLVHEWQEFQKKGIGILCYGVPPYPPLLQNVDGAPPILYYLGDPDACLHTRCIAVVGTRKMSLYGERVSGDIAKIAAEGGCAVVSGLALGVDAKVHKELLHEGGDAIAVLGSGLYYLHPSSNEPLAKKIIKQGGVILSEYPPHTQPQPNLYPPRNRIISGISTLTIVVEAGKKSGALITAHHAAQQGRDVYVVPGSVYNASSVGTNSLLAEGAQVLPNLQSLRDILHLGKPKLPVQLALLSLEEQIVVKILQRGAMGFDDLIVQSDFSSSSLLSLLTALLLKRYIREDVGGIFYLL